MLDLCFVLLLPSVCVLGCRSFDFQLSLVWYSLFIVINVVSRLRVQTRRGPLDVCCESLRRVLGGTGRQSGRIWCFLWLSIQFWPCLSVFSETMDRLPSEKQELLRESSAERLRDKLTQFGWEEEKVLALSRSEFLEAAAEVVLVTERADDAVKDVLPVDRENSPVSSAVQLRKLELEEKRLEREERQAQRAREDRKNEVELELKKLESQERRLAAAAEEKRMAVEAEERRARSELEKLRLEADRDVRLREAQRQSGTQGTLRRTGKRQEMPEDTHGLIRWRGVPKCLGTLCVTFCLKCRPKMLTFPNFFETVEKLFLMYEVPDDIKSKLLLPVLTAQAKALVNRMSVESMGTYSELKRFLLVEYKVTPREFKVRIDTNTKSADKTYVLFAARLRNLLQYYLASKNVGNNFDKLCDLIIADRLKGSLSHGTINYVCSLEGDDWFEFDRVATLSDIYVSNRADSSNTKTAPSSSARVVSAATVGGRPSQQTRGDYAGQTHQGPGNVNMSPSRRCFVCNMLGHLAKDCPKRVSASGYQPPQRGNFRGAGSYPHQFGSRVN